MSPFRLVSVALIGLALLVNAEPAAALPDQFIQEGLILDNEGFPIEGAHDLLVRLYADAQGGDPKVQVEPYLKVLQEPGFSDPGNFHTPWSELTPAQQAGVILAVNAAADGQCG